MRDPQDTKYVWDEENFKIIQNSISAASESERDDAIKELSLKQQTVTIAEGTIADLLKKVNRLEKQIEGLNNFANERFEEIERVRKERDDAWNTVDRLTQTGLDLMDSNKLLKNKIKKILNKK
jgi:hypothetical protein